MITNENVYMFCGGYARTAPDDQQTTTNKCSSKWKNWEPTLP